MSQPGTSTSEVLSSIIATRNKTGIHFKDAWIMSPHTNVSSATNFYDEGDTLRTADTTAFFTGFAQFGIQDNTNWTANTYKTIFSHTGTGLVYAMIACKAGGAETTTFEITIDGIIKTITITNANTERAFLIAGDAPSSGGTEFTTALQAFKTNLEPLDAGTLTTFQANALVIPPLRWYGMMGVPALRYDISCLIRMKHSVNITNTTAEAFSGVLVRKGISA